MFSSWKTSLFGIVSILGGIATIVKTGDVYSGMSTIIPGIGLLFGKDFNVTGSGK